MAINKNKVMDAARRAVEKGQVDRAIKEYLKVVREDPKDVRVWLKIGDLYAKKGSKGEATETYLNVAKFYGEQGFYLKAVAVYKQILKLDPRLVEVNLKLAELYRQLGLLSDAMQHFEMVAAHFHREGKTREALATIRQLVDLDPENVATRIKLAELYSKEGIVEDACTEFGHACDYLRKHNREDDFLKVAERLLWHQPANIELARELAGLYLRREDPRRALQKLQACFKADPRDVETLALLARAFQALGQRGKTVSVLKELIRILVETGQRTRAEEVHRKILEFVPDDPDSRAFLGLGPRAVEEPKLVLPDELGADPPARGPGRTGSMPIADPYAMGYPPPTGSPMPARLGAPIPMPAAGDQPDFAARLALDEDSSYPAGEASASGEVHSDEIIKILTETDVYVKYGLHQKAVDHLNRVFELDPGNVEARERLKDILLAQGRDEEAIAELVRLGELFATAEPERAEGYLREALAIDGSCAAVLDLAERYRLDVGGGVEIVDETGGIELDLDDALPPDQITEVGEEELELSDLEFDDAEPLDGDTGYEIDSAPLGAEGTMEVDLDQVEEAVPIDDLDPDSLSFVSAPDPATPRPDALASPDDFTGSLEPTVDTGPTLDPAEEDDSTDDAIGYARIAHEPAFRPETPFPTETPYPAETPPPASEELPFDPVDARMFDAEVHDSDPLAPIPELLPAVADPTKEVGSPPELHLDTIDAESTDDSSRASSSSGLEDDLDEADFFVSQGLYGEARDILEGLLQRYPSHPLVLAKLRDVDRVLEGAEPEADESVGMDTVDEIPRGADGRARSRPAVLLENPVDDEDADTHYDLGLAYKEMGLFEEAIKAFQKVIHVRGREVPCHLMIGLCHREQGHLSEAINQFKAGLYVEGISDVERFGLYYEIGVSYELLDDPQEALYYYEMIHKKDPGYRDVAARVAAIRSAQGGGGENGTRQRKSTLDDETDAALGEVLIERGGD